VRRAAQAQGPVPPYGVPGGHHGRLVSKRATGSDFPAYPRPAGGGDRPPASGVPPLPPVPPRPPQSAAAAPPSWQPDPSGRFHYRWWTGAEWTSYVSTHGQVVVDTIPTSGSAVPERLTQPGRPRRDPLSGGRPRRRSGPGGRCRARWRVAMRVTVRPGPVSTWSMRTSGGTTGIQL